MNENIWNCWKMREHDFKIISKPYDLMTEAVAIFTDSLPVVFGSRWLCSRIRSTQFFSMLVHTRQSINHSQLFNNELRICIIMSARDPLFQGRINIVLLASWLASSGTAERCVSMISILYHSHTTSLTTDKIWKPCWIMREHDLKIVSQPFDLTHDRKHLEMLKDAWAWS